MTRTRLAGAVALAAAAAACRRGLPPVIVSLPDFAMTAVGPSAEKPFGLADMKGKVWIADFIFTHCAGPCPLLTERMARLEQSLPAGVNLLTVTVDPDGDTPDRLRAYSKAYDADSGRWVFLRGTTPQTYRLLYEGFRLTMSSDASKPADSRVMHSTQLVLVDGAGGIHGYYDGLSDLDNAALARDAARLLEVGS